MDKHRMAEAQKAVYLEAYMAQQAAHQALQQQQQQQQQPQQQQPQQTQKSFRYSDAADEKHKKQENGCAPVGSVFLTGLKVPQPAPVEATFTVPDDGLGYDDGVRVLRTLGSWTPEYAGIPTRPTPGVLFAEIPYAHPDMTTNTSSSSNNNHSTQTSTNRKTSIHRANTTSKKDLTPAKQNGISSASASASGGKSFTCTICGKALARKDKLVIHTRIHTGEKPYVCEVCDKAFARRDKLVIHMNKMKHRTPSNVAPLGKRGSTAAAAAAAAGLGGNSAEKPSSSSVSSKNKHQQQLQHSQHELDDEGNQTKVAAAAAALLHSAAANWSCELCGQMMTTREEWMVHAKAHLEEKVTGIGVIAPGNYAPTPPPTVAAPPPPPPPTSAPSSYQPHTPASAYQPFLPERHYCPVCRQSFTTKPEFMVHVRAHFEGSSATPKPTGADTHLEPIEPTTTPTSTSALCS